MLARNTLIEIQDSAINFSGEPGKPKLDIKCKSNIEGVTIAIVLQGTLDKPDLKLSSLPPMHQDRLMIMLATGRALLLKEVIHESAIIPDNPHCFVYCSKNRSYCF